MAARQTEPEAVRSHRGEPRSPRSPRSPRPTAHRAATGARDVLTLVLLPLPLLAVTTAVSLSRWGWGRPDESRANAQAAKDAAADAFYQLDTAQRGLRISIETISAVDSSPAARKATADFEALGRQIDETSQEYITVVDTHDLDRDDLGTQAASRARRELDLVREKLVRTQETLRRFEQDLQPLLERAASQLAQVAPAVERARQALLAATQGLDAVRGQGLRADDLAARLAALSPELTKLNEGAGQHGVQGTIRRAEEVQREAGTIRDEAQRLPETAAEMDRRLVSLRTRAQALATRAETVEPVLSELRRRFSAACWQDLQPVSRQAAEAVARAEERLGEARRAREDQRWPDATALLSTVRSLLNDTDEAVSAAGERLRRLNEVAADHKPEVERARFAIRDAQRLAMAGRSTPDPAHAGPLDRAVEQVDRAVGVLENGGRHPDYWHFLTELDTVRDRVAEVVRNIREDRATGRP